MRTVAIASVVIVWFAASAYGIVAPKKGGKLPKAYYERTDKDPTAFRASRAWVQKVRALKAQREVYLRQYGAHAAPAVLERYSLSGDFYVPVLLGAFANRPAVTDRNSLQQELFDGPWPTGTLTQYYNEVSYGLLNVTGTVYDWFTVTQNDVWYEGTQNGFGPDNHTGQFLKELLDANDPSVDFGLYDNDGPDGVPNSGDDDGYVDFVTFVHSESGGECVNSNLWSHVWVYRGWPESGGLPYTTNDLAAGGGFIKVDDYALEPSLSCDGPMIEIGVFCHEFGHGFGLPDLYDANGPTGGHSGIGHWGIMGSGNWNTPTRPAHPCAWTKKELGWVIPTEATWQGGVVSIPQIETNQVAYKLPFTDDHFRRLQECAIDGLYSLRCGVTNAEGTAKGWEGSGGYGNYWNESIERDFTFDGTTPVTLAYDYEHDIEQDYDYAYTIIRVDGSETVLATYTGITAMTESELIDLGPILSVYPSPIDYQLIFKVETDISWSDEDNNNPTSCGAFIVDNVSVTGGGESYFTNFESFVDGWHQSPSENPATEYWLVENRQAVGFDENLHAAGLVILHVDDEVIRSANGNCGNSCFDDPVYHNAVRGVLLEEADGNENLANGDNRGDGGDCYPGTSNNTTFNTTSNPNSRDNTNRTTMISVTDISISGNPMSANLTAGDPPPSLTDSDPNSIQNDNTTVDLTVTGDLIRCGATMRLQKSGETDIEALSVEWVDPRRILGTFYIYGRLGGFWNLALTNPDGREVVLSNAIFLVQIVAVRLQSASISHNDGGIEIRCELEELSEDERLIIRRSVSPDGPWTELAGPIEETGPNRFVYLDRDVEPGKTYFYILGVREADGKEIELYRGSTVVPAGKLVLEQNYPNPFNPSTTISFYLPRESDVRLEIFDVNGKLIRTLVQGVLKGGPHHSKWEGKNRSGERVGTGVYIYRLTAGKQKISRKMIMLK